MNNQSQEQIIETVKSSLLIQLVKLLAAFLISVFLVLIIFCIIFPATESGTLDQKYNLPMVCIAIVLALAANLVIDYNAAQRLKNAAEKSKQDMQSAEEMALSLIDKAERVVDKYRKVETEVFDRFATARQGVATVRSSYDFKAVIESYPELKSNIHTQKLLTQLEYTENLKLSAKKIYSTSATKYNARIHSFPMAIFHRLFKLEDIEISHTLQKDEIVSDEELGI